MDAVRDKARAEADERVGRAEALLRAAEEKYQLACQDWHRQAEEQRQRDHLSKEQSDQVGGQLEAPHGLMWTRLLHRCSRAFFLTFFYQLVFL